MPSESETRDECIMWSQKHTLVDMLFRSVSMPDLSTYEVRIPIVPRNQPVSGAQRSPDEEHHPESPQQTDIGEAKPDTGIIIPGCHTPVVSLSCLSLIRAGN